MMNTPRNGYLAPWSNRREIVGLMGAFMIALISSSGHSDLFVKETRQLIQQLIRLMLVFFGLVTPIGQTPGTTFQHVAAQAHHKVPVVAHIASPLVAPAHPRAVEAPVSMEMHGLPMNNFLKHWTYIFEGKATLHDKPFQNASVLVRVTNDTQSVTQGTITGADGSYRLQVSIDGREGDPVDWTLVAYTPDFQKVELNGRNIVQPDSDQELQKDQQPIYVNTTVEFFLTLNH